MGSAFIHRNERLPLHVQVVEQLKARIETGLWAPGERLPTVRDLAASLDINYNTVRAAYQDLERQGYIVTRQGRGSFVAAHPPRLPASGTDTIIDLIDDALAAAASAGVPFDMVARAIYARSALFAPGHPSIQILFVECNRPDLEHHAAAIAQSTGIRPATALIDDLHGRDAGFFDRFDIVATTLFHAAEMQQILDPERAVLGLSVSPSYEDVLRPLTTVPSGTPIGLVCVTQAFAHRMEQTLTGLGLNHVRYLTAGLDRPPDVERVFDQAADVYVSRLGLHTRRDGWPREDRVHAYHTNLDASALRLLRREAARLQHA